MRIPIEVKACDQTCDRLESGFIETPGAPHGSPGAFVGEPVVGKLA